MNHEQPSLTQLERLGDVCISLHAELDHKTFTFEQLLNLNIGSVIELGRPTGENVDLYLEDVQLGSGEILIIDQTLAVRVADLKAPVPI